MNYAPLPRESYIDPDSGFGPGATELTDHEWNMLALCSRTLFCWEDSAVPMDIRGCFDTDVVEAVRETLSQSIFGIPVTNYLTLMDPMEFLLVLSSKDIQHLAIVKKWGGSDNFMLVAEARALTWFSYQRNFSKKVVPLRVLSPQQQEFVNNVNPWRNGQIRWK